jgi:hypothetical protein
MKHRSLKHVAAFAAALSGLIVMPVASAADIDAWDGQWHYDLAIYGWLPSIRSTVTLTLPREDITLPAGSVNATVHPSNYLSSLKFAAMFLGEARKGDYAVITDLNYVDLGGANTKITDVSGPFGRVTLPLNQDVDFGLRATLWTLGGSYTGGRGDAGVINVLAGFRLLDMRSTIDWNFSGPNGILNRSGSASKTINIWSGVIGAYGRVNLDSEKRWFIPYYADVGPGSHSTWTSMAYGGVGYRFDWGELVLAYKNVYYGGSGGQDLQKLNLGGMLIGANFHW